MEKILLLAHRLCGLLCVLIVCLWSYQTLHEGFSLALSFSYLGRLLIGLLLLAMTDAPIANRLFSPPPEKPRGHWKTQDF